MRARPGFAMVLMVMASLGGWTGAMWQDTETPYVYDGPNSHIFPDPAPQGAMVRVDWSLTKINRTCPGSVQRYFTNADTGKIIATMDTTPVSNAVKVGDNRLPRAFQLPPDLPPRVGYFAEVRFQCNLLQHLFPLVVKTPTVKFRMVS